MKKFLAVILAFLLMFALFGCDVDPQKEILGFWKGNPEIVDGRPLGSNMIIEFRNNGVGYKYVEYGNQEYEVPFTYTIEGENLTINVTDGATAKLKCYFEDGKMILEDKELNDIEEYLKIDGKD